MHEIGAVFWKIFAPFANSVAACSFVFSSRTTHFPTRSLFLVPSTINSAHHPPPRKISVAHVDQLRVIVPGHIKFSPENIPQFVLHRRVFHADAH